MAIILFGQAQARLSILTGVRLAQPVEIQRSDGEDMERGNGENEDIEKERTWRENEEMADSIYGIGQIGNIPESKQVPVINTFQVPLIDPLIVVLTQYCNFSINPSILQLRGSLTTGVSRTGVTI